MVETKQISLAMDVVLLEDIHNVCKDSGNLLMKRSKAICWLVKKGIEKVKEDGPN